ncbi:MAG: peptidoglycan-binding domain-containing protein [Enhygromyxa sp.]
MPTITLEQGDCLGSIALSHGFDPQTIWEHGQNAELRERRIDPNALLPGDQLFVPEIEEKHEPVETDTLKTFKLSVGPLRLRLRLTRHGEPRAGEAYELEYDQGSKFEGETDDDGFVDQPLPISAKSAILRLLSDGGAGEGEDEGEEYELALGHLDPHDEPSGAQGRLGGLGYYFGEVDGDVGPKTRAALRRFQAAKGLAVSGELDEGTVAALRDAFGS